MTPQEIFNQLKPVLAESLSRPESEILPTAHLSNDLGADSLDIVQTATDVENKFDVVFSDAEMEKIKTVQDIVDLLCTLKSAPAA